MRSSIDGKPIRPGQPPLRKLPGTNWPLVAAGALIALAMACGLVAAIVYADDKDHALRVACHTQGGHMANFDAALGKEYLTGNRFTTYTCVIP